MAPTTALGLDTSGAAPPDAAGPPPAPPQIRRNDVAEGVLADQVGLDCFGVVEHHRPDFVV
jgi:hypothetical protein